MAIAPIVLDFVIKGIPDVQRAFRTVQQTIEQGERLYTRTAETGARARLKATTNEARDKVRAMKLADREHANALKAGVREAEKAARAETRAVEQAAREKVRAWKAGDREISRARAAGQREAERAAAAEIRQTDRIEREKARTREKWLRDGEARQQKAARGRAGAVMSAGGQAMRMATGGVQRLGGTLMQLGGGFSVADAVQDMAGLEMSAMRFSNAAYMGTGTRMDAGTLAAKARTASAETGIGANDIMRGAHAYLAKTGKADEAVGNMKFLGEIAQGTGTDIEDVAKTAGTLLVQNEDLKGDKMKQMLLQTIRQGQKGSIEFSDLATSVGKVTRTASGYAGDQAKTQAELLGLAQLGMSTMSDPRDVATSFAGIESDTKKNWKKINKGMGGESFDADGRIKKGPSEFIADVMTKTGGDVRKLQDLGFNKQAMKYFQALQPEFQKAGGGQAGRGALLSKMKDAVAEPMPYSELQDNVGRVLKTSSMQFQTSVNELKMSVGTQLLPELTKLVPVMRDLTPNVAALLKHFVTIANWAADNPFKAAFVGVGAMVGKALVAEILSAKIGAMVSGAMGGGGGVGASAVSGLAGKAMGAAPLLTATAGTAAAATAVLTNMGQKYAGGTDRAELMADKLKWWSKGDADGMSPASAKAEIAAAQGRLDKSSWLSHTGDLLASPFSDDADKAYGQYKKDQGLTQNKPLLDLIAALDRATASNKALAASGGASSSGGSTSPANRTQPITNRTGK